MNSFSFPKKNRLLTKKDFTLFREGNSLFVSDVLLIYHKKNDLNRCRLGLAISKKFGNAVKRNKLKRILREYFRINNGVLKNRDLLICVNIKKMQKQKLSSMDIIQRANSSLDKAFKSSFSA